MGTLTGERHVIEFNDDLYPKNLFDYSLSSQKGPAFGPTLYVLGNPDVVCCEDLLSLTGAARPSEKGAHRAAEFAGVVAGLGAALLTGGAAGCQEAAMKEALALGVPQVAFLGTGADVAYPEKNKDLLQGIIDAGGAVVSAMPWGIGPRKYAFQQRKNYIDVLAAATFVAEARFFKKDLENISAGNLDLLSGSYPRCAAELGRPVYGLANGSFSVVDDSSLKTLRYLDLDELSTLGIRAEGDMESIGLSIEGDLAAVKGNEDHVACLYPLPEYTVRIPLTDEQADSMVCYGEDGELGPEWFVNTDGKPFCRVGADGDTYALYLVTWKLPEGTVLGDGADLSGCLLTTLECGPEPAMTLDPTSASTLAAAAGMPEVDLPALASAISEALDKVGEGHSRAHAPLAEQMRAAYVACERDAERAGMEEEREPLGGIDLRDEDIPY